MRTYIALTNRQDEALPAPFAEDDVRFTPDLVRTFLAEYTQPGQLVFDPFAGFGTTLRVAEQMGRRACGLELDPARCAYAQSRLRHPETLTCGDARRLSTYGFAPIDFSLTSPPYMSRDDPADPLTAYSVAGRGIVAVSADPHDLDGLISSDTRVSDAPGLTILPARGQAQAS